MKSAAAWLLLALVVLAASVKTYSLYSTTLDDPEMQPAVIAAGGAHAPNQFRLFVPLLWTATTAVGVPPGRAEFLLMTAGIVISYALLAFTMYRASGNAAITGILLLAFYGAASSGFWFRYRDTFFETAFASLGMHLIVRRRPLWTPYVLLSAVAILNRETWLFSLVAAVAWRLAVAGNLRSFLKNRQDVAGLLLSGLASALVLLAVHARYGVRSYHYALWQTRSNLMFLVPGAGGLASLGQTLWFAGSGAFAVWLLCALLHRAAWRTYVVAFVGSLLTVSFLISNWAETRIFVPAYAVMLISIAGGVEGRAPSRPPSEPPF